MPSNSEGITTVTQDSTAADTAAKRAPVSECADEPCASLETPSQAQIDEIIRKRVYVAVGIGFVPVPLVDLTALSALQLEMIHAICKAYNIPFKAQSIKSVVTAMCGGTLSMLGAPLLGSLAKAIPVVGFTTAVAAGCITGAATTYAVGCVFDHHFRQGGTLTTLRPEKTKEYFAAKIEEGKAIAQKMLKKKKGEQAAPEGTANAGADA